jgi:arabinofuranosyltransferase
MLAIGGWAYHHMNDDGFINLRVVSQIKAGNGPVFNAGERVEAATARCGSPRCCSSTS